ncbi:MAG: hypothetical protein K6A96_00825 [Prevotella sp.]|nr:hypothetical protein [Prevotella sp.]
MRKKLYLFFISIFLSCSFHVTAQDYLDIYQKGNVAFSFATNCLDSIRFAGNSYLDYRMNVYYNGNASDNVYLSTIDSIKFFNSDEEQLTYLGIIGFNQELYEKQLDVLASSTAKQYKTHVKELSRKDGSLLYYSVDHAIDMLAKENFATPLNSVHLVTFTDGLDQGSLMMNSSYSSDEQYLNAINNKISKTRIKGVPLTAYSLGLQGTDITNYTLFHDNLRKLASSSEKAFEVNSMNDVNACLNEISNQILSITNKQTISLKIPGQGNGTRIRFTLDGKPAANSSLFIEGVFNLSNRSLVDITYHGVTATNGNSIIGVQNGIFVTFTFSDIQRLDGKGLINIQDIQEFYKPVGSNNW